MPSKSLPNEHLTFIAAPMVNQSDLPFRILTRRHGITLAYTQMWLADKLLEDDGLREAALKDVTVGQDDPLARPVAVQLAGNDPQKMIQAARLFEPHCDAVDVNLGCPQDHARKGHFGGYLLGRKDWPLVEEIISSLVSALSVPVHAKIRLCNPPSDTPKLALRLAQAGASVITIHARHVSANRRRAGPAYLEWVRKTVEFLKESDLGSSVSVISNGNVEKIDDCRANMDLTGASGLMLGESILANPTYETYGLVFGLY
ncbi:hypothetical protein FRB90_005236 [Tulasnella sp. 427]|nr:hypothetical protein FRB90_005236 [Tulasnella sp. 427]